MSAIRTGSLRRKAWRKLDEFLWDCGAFFIPYDHIISSRNRTIATYFVGVITSPYWLAVSIEQHIVYAGLTGLNELSFGRLVPYRTDRRRYTIWHKLNRCFYHPAMACGLAGAVLLGFGELTVGLILTGIMIVTVGLRDYVEN